VITIFAMRYLGLKIDKPTSVTLKMANKRIVRPKGIISNVVIIIMKVSIILDFHVVLEEDGAYPMILDRPWLTKSHARNYWGEGYMTITIHPNRHKIPFANFVKSFGRTSEYDDESKTDQSSNFQGIYINNSNEGEVGLYVLEVIPKVGSLSSADQKVRGIMTNHL
jgi:hypothetical protein